MLLTAHHMPGMEGARETVSGAFKTTSYAASHAPTDGGARVTNHKWVVREELENLGSSRSRMASTSPCPQSTCPG